MSKFFVSVNSENNMIKCRLNKFLILIIFSWNLMACTIINPPEYRKQLFVEKRFNEIVFLCEITDWRPWGVSGKYIATPGGLPGGHMMVMPNLQEYYANPSHWKGWYDIDLYGRILYVLDKNTKYHITKITVSGESSYMEIEIII